MRIAFLHTAQVHVATFERVFADLASPAELSHHVDAQLLDRARRDGPDAVRADVAALLAYLSEADALLCTCSTLGPLADEAAQSAPNILRIDRPLMEQACADGAKPLIALCLYSTRDATLDLLADCAAQTDTAIDPIVVFCPDAWACFEAADTEAFATAITRAITAQLAQTPDVTSIILAQASMAVAEAPLAKTGLPIRSSPLLAAKRCLEVARQTRARQNQ